MPTAALVENAIAQSIAATLAEAGISNAEMICAHTAAVSPQDSAAPVLAITVSGPTANTYGANILQLSGTLALALAVADDTDKTRFNAAAAAIEEWLVSLYSIDNRALAVNVFSQGLFSFGALAIGAADFSFEEDSAGGAIWAHRWNFTLDGAATFEDSEN